MLLIERVAFDELTGSSDNFGGKAGAPVERFTTRAAFTFLRGGEAIQAGRLAGTQPMVATVRRSAKTDALRTTETTSWQIRDVDSDIAYNIRSVEPNREKPRQYLDFLCESGT